MEPQTLYCLYSMNLCHSITHPKSYFLKVRFNIIRPPTSRSSKWALSLSLSLSGFPIQTLYTPLRSPIAFHMPHPFLIWSPE